MSPPPDHDPTPGAGHGEPGSDASPAYSPPPRARLLVVDDQPVNIHALFAVFADDHDVFAATGHGLSSNTIGSGVRLQRVAQQFSQGNVDFTNNNLDMAISGEGFFVMKGREGTVYSRAGAFSVGEGAPGVDAESAVKRVRPAPDSLSGIPGPGRRAAEQASHGATQTHFPQYFEFTEGFHLFRDQR